MLLPANSFPRTSIALPKLPIDLTSIQYSFSAAAQSTPFDYLVPDYPTTVDLTT